MRRAATVHTVSSSNQWRLHLLLVLIAQGVTFVALFFNQAFTPFYLEQDLGVSDPDSLKWWVGVTAAVGPALLVIFNPFWGAIADRIGQKPMLLRALVGSGVFMLIPAIATTPWEFLGTRLGMGVFSGVSAATIGLVSMLVPRDRMASSLGLVQTARIIGVTVGPALGGFMADFVGYRGAFLVAGAVTMGLSAVVFVFLPNPPTVARHGQATGLVERFKFVASQPGLLALMLFSVLLQSSDLVVVPYLPVLVDTIVDDRRNVASLSGVILSAGALSLGIAGLLTGQLVQRAGYVKPILVACALGAVLQFAAALAIEPGQLIATRVFLGLAFGVLLALSMALIGLTTPPEHRGLVFGLASASAPASALVGPLLGSFVAVMFGVRAPFFVASALLGLAGILAWRTIREPQTS